MYRGIEIHCYVLQTRILDVILREILGKRNPTSTKGRSRWKSSSENYLLISEVRFRVRFRVRVRVRFRFRVRVRVMVRVRVRD